MFLRLSRKVVVFLYVGFGFVVAVDRLRVLFHCFTTLESTGEVRKSFPIVYSVFLLIAKSTVGLTDLVMTCSVFCRGGGFAFGDVDGGEV